MATPDESHRRSVYEIVRLPEAFGVVLLTVALVLFLSPYLSGADFGIFKIPSFPASTTRALKFVGPVVFVVALFLFLPIWRAAGASAAPQMPQPSETQGLRSVPGGIRVRLTSPESVPDLLGRAVSRHLDRHRAAKPYFDNLATVVAELALNAFEHGGASYVDIGLYSHSVVLQDDGAEFNPLLFTTTPSQTKRQDLSTRGTVLGGAGLFALNHLLRHARPPIAADYRSFGYKHVGEGMNVGESMNQLVLYLLEVDSPDKRSTAMFNIRLRGRTDEGDLRESNIAHVLELRWGFSHYVLDPNAIYKKQIYRLVVISRDSNFVQTVMERIPSDAVLHLRFEDGASVHPFYIELAKRYRGRLVIDLKS